MKKFLFRSLTLIMVILGVFSVTQVSANPASIDSSFSVKAPVGFLGTVYAMATQSNGKIIVGGDFTIYK